MGMYMSTCMSMSLFTFMLTSICLCLYVHTSGRKPVVFEFAYVGSMYIVTDTGIGTYANVSYLVP